MKISEIFESAPELEVENIMTDMKKDQIIFALEVVATILATIIVLLVAVKTFKHIDFIKEASLPENISKPYFLCLDEMNLARVEYYMSDFLSIIETRDFDSDKRIKTSVLMSSEKYGTTYFAAKSMG